jgi:broad specificity phosphatase PhoE
MLETYPVKTRRIFLARHGESEANQNKLISGQLDVPLTKKGRNQAQWLCDVLKNVRLAAVYSSSLARALDTARPTANFHRINVQVLDNLKEIHFGILQGRSADETDAEAKSLFQACQSDPNFRVPDGESFQEFQQRIWHCFESLMQTMPDNSLIVAHRNTNEVILTRLLGLDKTGDKTINIKNKYVYEINLGVTPSPTINTIRLGGEHHGKKFIGFKDD